MRYFKYSKRRSEDLSIRIWEELLELKNYAKSFYNDNWEDAILDSYIHILNNYDESKGFELHNYVIRVVKTIYRSKFGIEISDEDSLNDGTDKESEKRFKENNEYENVEFNIDLDKSDVEGCKKYLLTRFVEDFTFFDSLNIGSKFFDYSDLREMFSESVIVKAVMELKGLYTKPINELREIGKKYRHVFRKYSPERYKKAFDEYVEFECMIGDVVLYKNKSIRERFIYKVNIRRTINRLMLLLSDELSRCVEDTVVWCTLSGFISCELSSVKNMFEQEIVCRLLSSTSYLKILAYEKGTMLYLSSTRGDLPEYLYMDILDKRFGVKLESVVAKEV